MGDSNSRPDGPKPPALPTALIPDFWLLSFAPDVVKHVVRRFFWPHRLAGEVPVSQAYQGIAGTVFSGLKGERPAPKPGAIPTSLYPDIHFSAMIPRRTVKIKFFLSVVIPVVKAAFVPFSAIGGNPASAGVARLCGVSPHPIPDTTTARPNRARYQLRYTRICAWVRISTLLL